MRSEFLLCRNVSRRHRADSIKFMFVDSTTAEALSAFTFSSSPCSVFSCVAIVSHTFQQPERSERVTKLLNTLKYSERSRRSVCIPPSTWRDSKRCWLALVEWIFYFFREERDNRQNQTAELCKKYKRIKCLCLVFKENWHEKKYLSLNFYAEER